VHGQADRIPALAAYDSPAEELDIVVTARGHELVERLLEGPHRRCNGAGHGAAQRPGAIDPRTQGQTL
jgi:hypothetical protein